MSAEYCGDDDCRMCHKPVVECDHHFVKLNDETIYCEKCGDTRSVGSAHQCPVFVHVCPPCTRTHYDWTYTWTNKTSPYTVTF